MTQISQRLLLLLVIFISCYVGLAQPRTRVPTEQNENETVLSLILAAQALEPELAVDVILKLAKGNRIKDPSRKKQLLVDSFYTAHTSKEKTRRKAIPFNGEVLTDQATFVSNASRFGFDTFSLQTRIIREIIKFDRKLAYEMSVQSAANRELKISTCDDRLVYDPSDWYSLAEEVSRSAFDEKDILENKRSVFLTSYIEGMTSPSEVGSASRMLNDIDLHPDELSHLASVFSKALTAVKGDDMSFSYFMNFENASVDLARFSNKLHFNPPVFEEYRNAVRKYLTSNLSRKRCDRNVYFEHSRSVQYERNDGSGETENLPRYIADLNQNVFKESPILLDEVKPESLVTSNTSNSSPNSERIREFQIKLNRLRFWKEELPTTAEQKQEHEWHQEFSKTLESIAELKARNFETEMETFHQKCLFYRLMFREALDPKLKASSVRSYLNLLNDTTPRKNSVAEWFLEFDSVRNEVNGSEFKQMLIASPNNAIRVYMELERVTNNKPAL